MFMVPISCPPDMTRGEALSLEELTLVDLLQVMDFMYLLHTVCWEGIIGVGEWNSFSTMPVTWCVLDIILSLIYE